MNKDAERLIELLGDERFVRLAREDAIRPLSWDEISKRDLPAGWEAKDAWEALFSLRRITGVYIPKTHADVELSTFYTTNGPFLNAIVKIAAASSRHSPLYQQLRQKESFRFKQNTIVNEAKATAQLDGIQVDPDVLDALIYSYRLPSTPQERIISNVVRLLAKLESVTWDDFDETLLRSLYDQIVEGIDDDALDKLLPAEQGLHTDMLSAPHLYDFANDKLRDPYEPSIVTALMLRETLQVLRPFPHLNNTMSWIVFRLYSIRHDCPVIAYLPTVSTTLSWERGELPAESFTYGFADEADTSPANPQIAIMGKVVPQEDSARFTSVQEYRCDSHPEEGDLTHYIVTYLEIIIYALESLQKDLDTGLMDLHELSLIDTSLNYRQNAIVLRARRNPDERFTIRRHQMANGIAYASARADLLELAKKGYLEKVTEGRKFVFVPKGKR